MKKLFLTCFCCASAVLGARAQDEHIVIWDNASAPTSSGLFGPTVIEKEVFVANNNVAELFVYKAEEPEKILVASASIHGHTRAAAHTMAEKLRAQGAKVVEMDLTRTDVSYAVTEAFRCGRIVLACATYDGFLFPPMENLLTHLKTKSFQNRTVGLMENGTWAPMAAKLMRAELESMKNITLCENVVTIRSAANAAAEAQMDALAAELVAK